FILFTGKGREEIAMEALNLGADRYVRKEGDPESQFVFLAQAIAQEFEHFSTKGEKKEKERKVKELYEASIRMSECTSEDEVYEQVLNSAQEILNFKASSIAMVDDGEFVIKATIAKNLKPGDRLSMEGIRANTYKNKKSYLVEDITQCEEAEPTDPDFKSAISVPIKDEGVFQTLAYQKDYFDEFDLEMAETLTAHMSQVLDRIRSEKELQRNEKKYRTMFESANDGIFIIENYNFIDCNATVTEMFKEKKENIIGKPPWEFAPEKQPDGESSKEKAKRKIERALEGKPQFFEWIHEDSEGRSIATEVSLNRYELNGKPKVMAIVRDITESKERKKELKKSKEKIESLHNVATEMAKCSDEDEVYELTIEAANDVLDFHDCTLAVIDENSKELIVKKTLRGEYEDGTRLPLDTGYLGKSYQERTSFLIEDPLKDEIAKPASDEYRSAISVPIGDIGVFQAMSDKKDYFDQEDLELAETLLSHTNQVLERMKSDRELKEREQRFRNIFDHALVGIYRTTPDGELLAANPRVAEMMGYDSIEELQDKDLSEIADTLDYSRQEFKEIMEEKGKVEGFEGTHLLPDGSILHTIENAVAVKDEEGNIKYYDGTMQDITELKSIQQKLEESEKKYRAIFENTGTATAIVNGEGKITLANRKFERLIGHFGGGVEGKEFFEFVVEEDKKRLKRFHKLRREDPESAPNEYDFQCVTKQGKVKDIHLTVNLIPDTDRSVASLTDITEKKEIMKSRDRYRSKVEEMKGMLDMMEGFLKTLSRTDLDQEQKEQVDQLRNIVKKNKEKSD
ncbi:MAG: PAS domain S-box protein, partial [Candidatus Natronoplasma sp.]